MERRMVVTQREVNARLVPVGTPITIPSDTFVTLTQSLGGNYTVVHNGNMARIDGTDADALGFEPQTFEFEAPANGEVSTDQIWEVLDTVFDPEIPVSIVALGLVYDVTVSDQKVSITMTLTAPGCGMGPVLVDDVKYRVAKVPNVNEISVELVFDPPWSRDRMSEEAQLETGMFF
ncbi:putative Fe-S cluster assembly protein SufT [Reinekea marina]|uniref:Fe-S cluster assembly protein SufT n=1 Tax=Reinekea marina TaxID=1310421 RepID=A0ABV7WS76_9GAMM|nr:putative Fe-S cluster assembly protein SufT [Reinekea marina]MBU2862951.1 putative Fe-S cluster assembly protein SufT [Reinekea forsetii]MDN3649248.1 putative Fe-S cluster assembly protein SufT [Reinekea marina]